VDNKNVKFMVNGKETQAIKILVNGEVDCVSIEYVVGTLVDDDRKPTVLIGSRRSLVDIKSLYKHTLLLKEIIYETEGSTIEVMDYRFLLKQDDRCKEYVYLIHELAEPMLCEEFGDLEKLP